MKDIHEEFQKSRFFHEARINQRAADALIGISIGMMADGKINQNEAEFLKRWIETNLAHLEDPVINLLFKRLEDMLSDGVLDEEESAQLLEILKQFTGISPTAPKPVQLATSLPLCNPLPTIIWPERVFVFTGAMAYGPRKICEELIIERGGLTAKGVSKKIHYVVVGSIGNDQWLHSSYGAKIKQAVDLRESGNPISIISEEHWQNALFG